MAKKTSSTDKAPASSKSVEAFKHDADSRLNIPTAEYESVVPQDKRSPIQVEFAKRNRDLDPQLMWRGKDEKDWSDLVVSAPPLYIQEKVHPKALIDDLRKHTNERACDDGLTAPDLFLDFNGIPKDADKTEFYKHDQHWSNRMILGDSLQVMASLAEREGLRGKVQCIYFDPPYGIKFNSNFQWSTTSRDVKDGNADHITREPEMVKAFRDTWKEGIHSYLTYLRDRLMVARDLLTESGSIFVQIGDENVHRVRAVLDEVFGDECIASQIAFRTTTGRGGTGLSEAINYLLWYVKSPANYKYRALNLDKADGATTAALYSLARCPDGTYRRLSENEKGDSSKLLPLERIFRPGDLTSARPSGENDVKSFDFNGKRYTPGRRTFATDVGGLKRLALSDRLFPTSSNSIQYIRYLEDYPAIPITNIWNDTGTGSFTDSKVYVVQTASKVVQRCILMATDPGDLVLDPTCGSGTTAYVAEQWGRRWITIDTSRVALALARARIMGARYPYYLLADSVEGQRKEGEVTRTMPSTKPAYGNLRHGFVYERVPHITLKSIANNAEIDVIWDKWQAKLEPLREALNKALKKSWQEWEIPREVDDKWSADTKKLHADWWAARIARQKEIDASIAAKAEFEYLYDKPYEDKKKVRVAGPFTVESLSPHRTMIVGADDELIDPAVTEAGAEKQSFAAMILDNLKAAGVQQAHKADKITFTGLTPIAGGGLVCAVGTYREGDTEKKAGIFIGPEFGTVQRADLVAAARECADLGFDVLIACAFSYDGHSTEFSKLGALPVLKARMNADLHMSDDLKNTGKGNLFVIFGEPDIDCQYDYLVYTKSGAPIGMLEPLRTIASCQNLKDLNAVAKADLKAFKAKFFKDIPARTDKNSEATKRAPVDARQNRLCEAVDALTAADFPLEASSDKQVQVRIFGVDVFHPQSGEVRSDGAEGIACWFLDTDYNEESFFVRHAYFLGANDPYSSLKTTLKAEIDKDAWDSLHSDTSRPFPRPQTGRIAIKVINHLGDEVMKVFKVGGAN